LKWGRTGRKRERKKISSSEPFLPNPVKRIPKKIAKKFKKIEKHHIAFISSRNRLGPAKKERKTISHSEPFLPNPSERNPKKFKN